MIHTVKGFSIVNEAEVDILLELFYFFMIKASVQEEDSIIIKYAREFQKNICFCFTEYAKAFDCVDHNKLENS